MMILGDVVLVPFDPQFMSISHRQSYKDVYLSSFVWLGWCQISLRKGKGC